MRTETRTSVLSNVRRHSHFYLFISPFFILFAIFGLYPLIFSLYLSFVKWDGLTAQTWVGLGNFATMLGVVVGVLIMGTAQNAINLLNIPPFYQYVASGMILLAAVLLDRLKRT